MKWNLLGTGDRAAIALLVSLVVSAPAGAAVYTVDDVLGTGAFDDFQYVTADWDLTFHAVTAIPDVGDIIELSPGGGTFSDPTAPGGQDWVIFSVTVNSADFSIEQIGFGTALLFANGIATGYVETGGENVNASGGGTHGSNNIFFYDGAPNDNGGLDDLAGPGTEFTDVLVVAFAPGTFTQPSHENMNFMVLDSDNNSANGQTDIKLVPEPATAVLLGLGLLGLGAAGRSRKRS